jgi:hypothetical protein
MEPERFVADVMVGKLARWLRVLGVDVLYDPRWTDPDLIGLARRERRVLLTRDRPLARQPGEPERVLIESDDFRAQLRQVVSRFSLDRSGRLFTRCIECNHPLEKAPVEQVRERVPPYVWATQASFKRCHSCDKIFWGGTHRDQMIRVLDSIFSDSPGRGRS